MNTPSPRRPKIIHRISDRGFAYEEIALDNVLASKLGGPIPDACLNRAERALNALKDQYLEWAYRDLELLKELVEQGDTAQDDAGNEETILGLRRLSHDMRGQGGTFGYPLVSRVSGALNDVLKMPNLRWEQTARLIHLHADIVKKILDNRIEGEGGKAGPKIIERLRTVTESIVACPDA